MAERADGFYWTCYQNQWVISEWGTDVSGPGPFDESKKCWLQFGARSRPFQDHCFDLIDETALCRGDLPEEYFSDLHAAVAIIETLAKTAGASTPEVDAFLERARLTLQPNGVD